MKWVERIRTHRLFKRESSTLTPWQVVGWWESRRVIYNLVVGVAGVFTIILCVLSALISEAKFGTQFGLPDSPFFAVVGVALYAIGANVFYTGGWIVEIALIRLWRNPWPDFAPMALAVGLAFSVLLTLTPAVISISLTVVQFFVGPLPGGGPE